MSLKPGAVTMAEIRAAYPALGVMADVGSEPLADPETSEWLDGPGLVRWLEHRGLSEAWLDSHYPHTARAARRWRLGRSASLNSVDELLLNTPYTLHDIPRELWLVRPRRKPPTYLDSDTKAEILERYDAGEQPVRLAEEFGITQRTIRAWVAQRRQKAA